MAKKIEEKEKKSGKKSNKNGKAKPLTKPIWSILTKLIGLFLIIFIIPVGFLSYLGYLTLDGLAIIKAGTKQTGLKTDSSYKKTLVNSENISKLQSQKEAFALAGHLELILKSNLEEFEDDPEEVSMDDSILEMIKSTKIGNAGYICLILPKDGIIVVHPDLEYGDEIKEELPNLGRVMIEQDYLTLLAAQARTAELREQGLGGVGLSNRRAAKSQIIHIKDEETGEIEKEFWILTPLEGTKFTMAAKASLAGLGTALLQEVSGALDEVKKNVITVEQKSSIIEKSYRLNFTITIVVGIFFLIIIFIFLRKGFIKPISHLTRTAEKIREGDLKVRTRVKTKDELQILGESFNSMLDRIAKQIETLGLIESSGKDISSNMELEGMLLYSLEAVCGLVKAQSGMIYLIDQESGIFNLQTVSANIDKASIIPSFEMGEGIVEKVFVDRKSVNVENIYQNSLLNQVDKQIFHGQHLLCVPLCEQDTVSGIIGLLRDDGQDPFGQEDVYIADTLSTSVAIQIKNIALLAATADKARMDQELKTAQAVQAALMPAEDPEFDKLDISGFFQSASETGGDWYGFLMEDKLRHFLIGDVTGHGTPAALVTAAVKGTITNIQENMNNGYIKNVGPEEILSNLNKTVYETGQQKFVMTFFGLSFDPETGDIVFANAGHNSPWFCQDGGLKQDEETSKKRKRTKVSILPARGHRLGFRDDSVFKANRFKLKPGDVVVLYTDGLIECENLAGEEYGKRRARKIIADNVQLTAAEIKDLLIKDAFDFFEDMPRKDDVTVLVMKVRIDAEFSES